MKAGFAFLILAVAIPVSAFGHSELYFPRLYSLSELPNTGFALLNPDPITANVTCVLISPEGREVTRTSFQIPAGGQLARLGSELFTNPSSGGWIYCVMDTEGMQGFWLNYDSGITFLDGAEAIQLDAIGPDQIIPLAAGQTEITVINPNGIPITVDVRVFGTENQLGSPFTRSLPLIGGFQSNVSALFPGVDMTQARYIRIRSSGAPITSSAIIKDFLVPADAAVVNGVNVSSRIEMVFPHVINGALTGASYTTVIGVTNLSNASQPVTISFNPESGGVITVTRTLAGNGALRETAQTLFGLSSGFQSGWIRVLGSNPVSGFAAYADSIGGGFTVVPASQSQTSFFFCHIADGPPQWQTGLAILNGGTITGNVDVYALNPSGSLIGTATLSLDPGRKIARVIHELIPQARGVNGGFVYIRTRNNVPLFGIELFYTEDLKVVSNVASGRVVPGVNYVPPNP